MKPLDLVIAMYQGGLILHSVRDPRTFMCVPSYIGAGGPMQCSTPKALAVAKAYARDDTVVFAEVIG